MSETLQELLDSLTVEGTLYEKLPDNAVRCYACGHRCLIKEGRQGICKVRFNAGGALRVPWGYVGALQCDPTEKKPFFHIYPGSDTLTFGMLGCDFHCGYCFPPETPIVTDRGVLPIGELFRLGEPAKRTHDAEISFPKALQAVTSSGQFRSIVQVFKHHYMGWMTVIKPYYLPELQCTVDHRVYATDDPEQRPTLIRAEQLTERHYLAIPRQYSFSSPQVVDVPQALAQFSPVFRTPHYKTTSDIVETFSKPAELVIEDGTIRFAKEQRPGIPVAVAVDESFATLLGYYCAEGSVLKDKSRSNSHSLVFAFGLHEADLADEVRRLIKTAFGLTGRITPRRTTLAVSVSKSSLALLFKALCGTRADGKHVPQAIFDAPRPVAQAFLDAYRRGDGHRYANGKLSATTVSRELAYGVAWLSLKLGSLPSLYANRLPARKVIEGRLVKQLPIQYTVVWYEETSVERKYFVTDEFYLIPIRAISSIEYNGDVYNLEVEGEHNYLANFVLVSNCQNWVTSQTLRDNTAGVTPQVVTPQELASMAKRNGAKLVGSSYNEPLITSEWAVAVFKEAIKSGLQCVYISNGNCTRETLEYIRPYTIGYKIDLKSMNDKRYRQLGGVLQNTLDGIKLAKEMGFWVEVVTLTIHGFNDSNAELMDAARYIASVSPNIPWHVTAFHPDYKMTDPDRTTADTLLRAAEIGQEAGLNFVYAGNLPGMVGDYENTYCPNCQHRLIGRYGYVITDYDLTDDGHCPKCQTAIPGIWPKRSEVRLGSTADLFRRVPRRVR